MSNLPSLHKENISFSLFLTDQFYGVAVEVLVTYEQFLTNFLRDHWPSIYLKNSDVFMDEQGVFTFEYLFDLDDQDIHISCQIGSSLSTVYIDDHKASFRDLSQLLEFLHVAL